LPSLWPGDVVVIENNPEYEFLAGDIALALHEGGFRLHRLVDVGANLIMRGDALAQGDPPVVLSDLLGRVVSVERNGYSFSPPRMTLIRQALGHIFCRCDLLRNWALRIRSARRGRSDRDAAIWPLKNA